MPLLEEHYFEPLEVQHSDFGVANIKDFMAGDVLFPRRITGQNLKHYRRSGFGREASVFFLDAAKVDDIIDFWNLRAIGRATIPVPKQLQADPQWKAIVDAF